MPPAHARGRLGPLRAGRRVRVLRRAERPLPHRRQPVARAPAGDGRRRDRHRADARHPHRRRRPLVRHGDGARRHRDDASSPPASACRSALAIGGGLAVTTLFGLAQRPARHARAAAAVHRHARHAQHRVRAHAAVLARADCHRLPDALTALGDTFRVGGTRGGVRRGRHARALRASPGSCCARRPPAATCTRSAATPRRRGWRASPRARVLLAVYALAGLLLRPRGAAARSRAPASATRTPGRPRTSRRSPPWCSAAPACSAAAASCSARSSAR